MTVRGTVTDASAVTVTLNGVALVIAADASYQSTIALSEGPNILTLVATDAAGNATTVVRSVTLDTTAPTLTVVSPADGTTVPDAQLTVSGTATDQSAVRVTVNGGAVALASGGAFSASVALVTGSNAITVVATDSAGNVTTIVRNVTRRAATQGGLPPDPATVAPALSRTVATTLSTSTAFLYTGSNPIQTGVATGTMTAYQTSVIRGRLITRDGQPAAGVVVSVLRSPEFGQTLSRQDGAYDLAVNGGEVHTLSFAKSGLLPAQRQVLVPRQRWVPIDPVAMVALDSTVTNPRCKFTSATCTPRRLISPAFAATGV